jgi:hypothetical protein
MAWWLTVYCKKPVSGLQPEQLDDGLWGRDFAAPAGGDYHLLAEARDIEDADVDDALEQLEVVRVSDKPLDVQIRYKQEADARPIVVHLWQEPERVAEEIEEALDNREPPERVKSELSACREIVGIELGFGQLQDMGFVLAFELARYLAQKGDGVIVDDENAWYAVEDGELIELE